MFKIYKNIQDVLKKRLPLFKDDLFFLGVVGLFLSLISAVFIYIMYTTHQDAMKKKLHINSNRINNILLDVFDETNILMVYIGKQISKHGNHDLNFINYLLKNKMGSEYKNNNILSWTLFDWVSPENLQLVNHTQGISSHPPDLSHREYTWKCKKHPWTLQVSKPAIGHPSGEWVIPAGTGVTDPSGKFLGTIVVGFSISDLNEVIEEKLVDDHTDFIILDNNYNIVLKSSGNLIENSSDYYKNHLRNSKTFTESDGFLKKPISFNSLNYVYYKKMKDYPYIILTGFDADIINKELYSLFLLRIIELTCVVLFFILFLYLYRLKIINLSKTSDKAKEDFIRNLNQQLQHYIDTIYINSNILLQYFKGDIDIGITKERQIEFISHIQEASSNLRTFTSSNLEFNQVDIHKVVKDAISIQSQRALIKNVIITTQIQPNLPLIYADEFCFKQILVGLISKSLERMPTGGGIKITAFKEKGKQTQFLNIMIQDDGFGLSEEDLERINQKFNINCGYNSYGIDVDMAAILKLVQIHGGSCEVQILEEKGRLVILRFFYLTSTANSNYVTENAM